MSRRASASAAVGMAADASEVGDSEFGVSVMSPRLQRSGTADLGPTSATVHIGCTSAPAAGYVALPGLSPVPVAGSPPSRAAGRISGGHSW